MFFSLNMFFGLVLALSWSCSKYTHFVRYMSALSPNVCQIRFVWFVVNCATL
jgi:hypothetical protein